MRTHCALETLTVIMAGSSCVIRSNLWRYVEAMTGILSMYRAPCGKEVDTGYRRFSECLQTLLGSLNYEDLITCKQSNIGKQRANSPVLPLTCHETGT